MWLVLRNMPCTVLVSHLFQPIAGVSPTPLLRACAAGRVAMAIMASSAVTAAMLPMSNPQ